MNTLPALTARALKEAGRALTELDPLAEHHDAALIDDALQSLAPANPSPVMVAAHSPLPWQSNPIGASDMRTISSPHPDGGGQNVVDLVKAGDAALIVRAVNNFDALVKVLSDLEAEIADDAEAYAQHGDTGLDGETCQARLNVLRAALARAKGGAA
jgi:hypothetical protein